MAFTPLANYTDLSIAIVRQSLVPAFLDTGLSRFQKQTRWPLVRKRTIPTERPPLVREILMPTFTDRGVSRGQRGGSPAVVNLSFLDRSRYISLK
jgi:hypothetical protein